LSISPPARSKIASRITGMPLRLSEAGSAVRKAEKLAQRV
jgi:hypothetical protein